MKNFNLLKFFKRNATAFLRTKETGEHERNEVPGMLIAAAKTVSV